MDILIIGSGGREHAICHALAKSPRVSKLYCAPGNGGIAAIAECVDIAATDLDALVRFAAEKRVDYVMVAPDDPLALGLVDRLEAAGIRAFGPRANAAILESSKIFSKSLMEKYGIPTAKYAAFTDADDALAYIRAEGAPIVVKADGLALGKGVVVAKTEDEAVAAVLEMMRDGRFGASGARVVIEECMSGPEVTVLAFTDGETLVPMLSSQDHKRARDGDEGPNTGGMGAFCPSPNYTPELAARCAETIFRPTVEAMRREGRPFKGVLYFGLMLTPDGPRVVEYNARFGDPEAQAVLSLLDTDLLEIFEAVTDGRLAELDIRWKPGASCCVVMASGGYPGAYEKGKEITGLDAI
ncbi:MAG: phosphoribosylamine--glycine ligase, partial [Oscillospiraceae bacterium]|nr:phosphoribosylamine--glycine ligase [Oscillospiraceae bacterium]